ncbi:uncharacterized protein T551_03668, partial [Pneumocystis jirovecii RU7]
GHSLARAVARAVKRQTQKVVQGADEEIHLFTLIVGKDYNNDEECRKKIETYCKGLKNAKLQPEEIHKKLEDICKTGKEKEKCIELKTKVSQKCTHFETELEKLLKNQQYDCSEEEKQCLFLERACPTLKDKCNELRNECYQMERDDVAEKALLRALNGSFKKNGNCKEKLKEVCLELSKESDEIMKMCLNQEKTCQSLEKIAEKRCSSLKIPVNTLLTSTVNGMCLLLLKKCYFYGKNCEGADKPKCNDLENECKKKGFIYTIQGSEFNPTKSKPTLAEKIGLKELYEKAAEQGIFIRKPPPVEATDLLALLILDSSQNQSNKNEKCKKILKDKCKDPKEKGILKDLCQGEELSKVGEKKCEELEDDIKETCKIFKSKVLNNHLYDVTKGSTGIIMWEKLPTFLSNEDCAKLESYCFYYEKACSDIKNKCMNIRAACYKKGLDAIANEVLQDKLRGLLHGSKEIWLNKFQQKLVEECKKFKEWTDELFVLCTNPARAARVLSYDLRMKAVFLRNDLNKRRDFPTKKDCEELEEKCRTLGEDSKEIEWPCRTLNEHCDRLRIAEQLEEKLLEEKTKGLDEFDSCIEKLGEHCNSWAKKGRSQFILACLSQNITCKIVTKNVISKCAALEEHMKTENIVNKAKSEDERESICSVWESYCDKFMSSCKNLTNADGNNKKCKELKENCKPYRVRKDREDAVMIEFKGHLDNKNNCITTLDQYCTQLNNANNGLETLCMDNTKTKKENKTVREELCLKLLERVQKKCPKLKKELPKVKKGLEKKVGEYKIIKDNAEKAMKKANLVLSITKAINDKSGSKNVPNSLNKVKNLTHFKLMKRDIKIQVTKEDLEAFDLVAQAFNLYVELKEICHHLKEDCGFRKECNAVEICEKIDGICAGLKPLEINSQEITAKNTTITTTTITTTTTTTVTDPKASECKSLQTTDTWVTQTSTHTSTSTTTSTITSKITLTSTRRCKPTKCTTGDDVEDVKPSEGLRVSGWNVIKGVIVAMVISFMI